MQRAIPFIKPVASGVVAATGTGLYQNPAFARSLFIDETEEKKNDECVNITASTDEYVTKSDDCLSDQSPQLTVSNLHEIASACIDNNSLHHLLPSSFNFHEKEIIMKEATKRYQFMKNCGLINRMRVTFKFCFQII